MARRPRTVDLQLRGVPAGLRDRLRKRASNKGLSMSGYAIKVLSDHLERPSLEEWLKQVRADPPVPGISSAQLVREARREADARIARWSSSTRPRR